MEGNGNVYYYSQTQDSPIISPNEFVGGVLPTIAEQSRSSQDSSNSINHMLVAEDEEEEHQQQQQRKDEEDPNWRQALENSLILDDPFDQKGIIKNYYILYL
jgi:hypothetical protein